MIKRMAILDWKAMRCFHLRIFLIPVISLTTGIITALFVIPTNVLCSCFFS
ncbi:hypothetical protein C823_001264 [Eubacterium plexicaudatum ASF492]|nr:hypothetical protein C823_001264 [Eubacterium plexicaudatum ASF492]